MTLFPPEPGSLRAEVEDFGEWYAGYPRKREKPDAAKAYAAARRKGITHRTLCAARDALIAEQRHCDRFSCTHRDHPREYVPYPASFIRKCLSDYIEAVKPEPVDNVREDGARFMPGAGWVKDWKP